MTSDSVVSAEITDHIEWLEMAVAELLADITIMEAEIDCVEERIKNFLEEYYGEVGKYFSDLRKINARIGQIARSDGRDSAISGAGRGDEFERDVFLHRKSLADEAGKKLYRKIAKDCHPDTSSIPNAAAVFAQANEAYSGGDLGKLIYIEQAVIEGQRTMCEDPVSKLERLEKKYELLQREAQAALKRKNEVRQSSSYKLWQRVFQERARGRDLVREIKNSVMQEIRIKEQILVKQGI